LYSSSFFILVETGSFFALQCSLAITGSHALFTIVTWSTSTLSANLAQTVALPVAHNSLSALVFGVASLFASQERHQGALLIVAGRLPLGLFARDGALTEIHNSRAGSSNRRYRNRNRYRNWNWNWLINYNVLWVWLTEAILVELGSGFAFVALEDVLTGDTGVGGFARCAQLLCSACLAFDGICISNTRALSFQILANWAAGFAFGAAKLISGCFAGTVLTNVGACLTVIIAAYLAFNGIGGS